MPENVSQETCRRTHEALGIELYDMKKDIRGISARVWGVLIGIVGLLGTMIAVLMK